MPFKSEGTVAFVMNPPRLALAIAPRTPLACPDGVGGIEFVLIPRLPCVSITPVEVNNAPEILGLGVNKLKNTPAPAVSVAPAEKYGTPASAVNVAVPPNPNNPLGSVAFSGSFPAYP